MIDGVEKRVKNQSLPCRECGNPSPIGCGGRSKSFCGKECEKTWRSRFYTGNKHRQGLKPSNAFPAGFEPWNKGVKGLHLSPGTEFKDGHGGTRTCDVGETTIRTDQNGRPRAWAKVAEPNVWIMRPIFNWIASGKKIPRGMVLHHEDRNTTNDSVGNLRLTTRADHVNEHREELLLAKRRHSEEAT